MILARLTIFSGKIAANQAIIKTTSAIKVLIGFLWKFKIPKMKANISTNVITSPENAIVFFMIRFLNNVYIKFN